MERGRPEAALRQVDAWPSLLGVDQVDTSPDFVQFSLDELQELKDTSTTDFNTLDFSDYTVDVIDALFPKPRGQLDPLTSYRTSPKRLREWRRLTTKAQQYLLGTKSSEQQAETPNSRPANTTTPTATPTTTGRASRTGSRKSYAAIVRMQPATPPPTKPLRQDTDSSLRKQQPESKKKTKQLSSLVAAASTVAQGPGDSSTEVDNTVGAIQAEISFPFAKSSQPEVAWKQVDSGTGASLLGGISQVETSDDDFVQFSLDELQELQATSTTEFNTLDFSDYTVDVIDALFPKKPKWGDLDPPASYRTSPKRLREWRRLTAKAQQYLVEKVQETVQRQLPADSVVPTTTGRAVRTRSLRKSHSPTAKKERKRPRPPQETDGPSKSKPKKRAKKRVHPSLEASSVASLLLDIRGKK